MENKINYDSVVNQKIKSDFVAREVKACFSYEMDAILKASDGLHVHDLPIYEDIENLYQYVCPECGYGSTNSGYFDREDCEGSTTEYKCPECEHEFKDEPENEPQDILEWWIVTEYLYKQLLDKGEPVLEWGNNYYWGRTCSGQSIMLDSVISYICKDMEILEGQKYSWKTK